MAAYQGNFCMMKLTTASSTVGPNMCRVRWATGTKHFGIIDIRFQEELPDLEIAGELTAIRHLLFRAKVFNRDVISGNGIQLNVSKGAIKKLFLGRSTKKHLLDISYFLRVRLTEITVEVAKDSPFLPADDKCEPIEIKPFQINYEPIITMNLVPVHITDHARRRYKMYIERANNDENSLKNPLKSLIDRLSNKSLVRETLPDRVLKHKLKKYKIDFAEFWTHPSSKMHYVIVNDPANDMKILVTVFIRAVNDSM